MEFPLRSNLLGVHGGVGGDRSDEAGVEVAGVSMGMPGGVVVGAVTEGETFAFLLTKRPRCWMPLDRVCWLGVLSLTASNGARRFLMARWELCFF